MALLNVSVQEHSVQFLATMKGIHPTLAPIVIGVDFANPLTVPQAPATSNRTLIRSEHQRSLILD